MNLKVPGAILPLGCAILSTRVKTVWWGLLQYPLRGKSILQVPNTGTRVLDNSRPFLCPSIVSFWLTTGCSKEHKYHILRQYWYTKNVPVFTNTGTFQYLGPEVYFYRKINKEKKRTTKIISTRFVISTNNLIIWSYSTCVRLLKRWCQPFNVFYYIRCKKERKTKQTKKKPKKRTKNYKQNKTTNTSW